jgi:hypothetical protein
VKSAAAHTLADAIVEATKAAPGSDRTLPGIPSDPDELAEAPLAQLDW